MPNPFLAGFVVLIAFLYASVGFGGGSGYLAAMSLFNVAAPIAASTALVLNIVVSGAAFINYTRHGHLRTQLLWPFVIGSIPAAFLGGMLALEQIAYHVLLNTVLLYVGLRLLFSNHKQSEERLVEPPTWPVALFTGVILGMLSGMLGIGGGIFLSPLILMANWGEPKQAASSAAGFILLNSISGLAGRAIGGTLAFGSSGSALVILGILGGLAGSLLGVSYLSGGAIRRVLGVVLLITVVRFLWVTFG